MPKAKKTSPLAEALLETAGDMHELGIMSDADFDKITARHLNVTTGYVSQLERGAKRPSGAALALLNVIRRKGMDAIL